MRVAVWVLTLRDHVAPQEHARIVKNFCPNLQVLMFVGIGFIWAMALTMVARTRLDTPKLPLIVLGTEVPTKLRAYT